MFVIPTDGRRVVRPDSREPLPLAGAEVPRSQYWMRRLQAGDVEITDPKKAAPAAKDKKSS